MGMNLHPSFDVIICVLKESMKRSLYEIPNYCINDPYFEKQLENENSIEEETLTISLFEITKNVNIEVEVSNRMTGEELKQLFCKKAKIQYDKYTFRIFFSGSEIKDDQTLGQHKLQDGFKLQIMKFPKQKNDDKKNEEKNDSDNGDKKKKKRKKNKKKK